MIQIGQTLHGYEDGHSLLASSQQLPYNAESTLLVLSDLSGQSFVSGFDEYLTGYPLTEANLYAFAKTWYAPEMERPGCVWTHTLLIRFGDLAKLPDLRSLKELFVRPTRSRVSWERYESSLKLQEERRHSKWIVPYATWSKIAGICDALYSSDTAAVMVPTVEASNYDDAFLSVWEQQWLRLRRRFTFCTGSIEGRELSGRSFDLQCIPTSFLGIGNSPKGDLLLINGKSELGRLKSEVLDTLLDDLRSENTALRRFIRDYGADAPQKRTAFAGLIGAWLVVSKGISTEDQYAASVTQIAAYFPDSQSVSTLKSDLVGSNQLGELRVQLSFEERFLLLLELSDQDAAVAKSFAFEEVSVSKMKSDPEPLLPILEKLIRLRNLNGLAQELIIKAAELMPWDLVVTNASPQLLLVFVGTKPELLMNSGVWNRLSGHSHEIVDIFWSRNSSESEWVVLCRSLIRNAVPQAAAIVFARAPFDLVPVVLNEFQDFDSYSESFASWFIEVEKQQPAAIEWIKTQPELSTANQLGLSRVLDPAYVKREAIAPGMFHAVSDDWDTRKLAFLLVIASGSRGNQPAVLFSVAFRKLHRFVTGQNLDYYAWEILRPVLPELSRWSNWDTAERLRRYYTETFFVNRWPGSDFWHGLEGSEVTREVFDYIASEKRLRDFGRELIAKADSYDLPEWQRNILHTLPKKLR
jgi:hypothetical protein